MTEYEFTYWAFLSHSQQDNCEKRQDAQAECSLCWGDWLHGELRTFSIPAVFAGQINARGEIISERIDPVFQDQEEQPGNASLSERVRQALDQSKCLIVICSPRSAKSLQVNEQVRYFKQLGRGSRILPIVIAGEPNASDGNKPGRSPKDECFVPALRHPVMPDGTLDTSRRDRNSIFADARHGDARQEILAKDHQNAEIELETAKIQLIAGLIGVGFHGLWGHELKRRFAEAHILARETRTQNQEGPIPNQEAQSQLLEAQRQAREALGQVVEARNETRAAEAKALESQNEFSQAQSRVQEIEDQARQSQSELEAAQKQAWAAEANNLETQQQARETAQQLEAVRQQLREAQHQVLEVQKLPQDVKRRIEEGQGELHEAQDQARTAKCEAVEARQRAQELENKVLESQNQAALAQSQVREIEDDARQTQNQLAEAQSQARAAGSKVLETQQQVRDAQNQLADSHQQARDLEKNFQESQNQVRQAQSQLSEAQNEAQAAKAKVLEAQNKIQQIESQNQAAQREIQEVQSQVSEAQATVRKTKGQVLELQNKNLAARRRTKVLAIISVLALMAAGTSVLQRKQTTPTPAKTVPPEATEPEQATGPLNQEQIQQALQKVSGGGLAESRLRSLDELAARIPAEEISNTLGASPAILAGPALNHFQEMLLDCWMKTNLPAAFDWSCQLTDTNFRQRALEKIIPAMVADNPTNTLAWLNDLKPAPDEQIYLLFFQRWAATDPVQAIEQRQQIPGHDAGDKILSAIMLVWVEQQPATAANWLQSQPDSESLPTGTWRDTMLATLFDVWAEKDLEAATTACQQLPDGRAKETAWECVLSRRIVKVPASAAESVTNLAPGDYRQKAIAELCRHWATNDASAAMAWVPFLPAEDERMTATNLVIASWAGKDPQAAAQFASLHPELSGAVLGEIASAWSQQDLSATTNWVTSLPDGEKKDTVLLALASSTKERAPLLAAKLCTLLTTNLPTTELVQGIATSLAKIDVTNAVEWARGLQDEPAREVALCALSEFWAQYDPQGMATYAARLMPGDAQTLLLTSACRQLAGRDFPGMVDLLKPVLDEALRQNILEQAGRDYDLLHLNHLEKCISAMPAGDDQQAALKGLLANWTAVDPEAALNWLVAFPETNAQPEQVQSVIKAWAQSEPAAVAKWLTNSPAGMPSDDMVGAFLEGALMKYPAYAANWTQSVTNETQRQKFQVQVARQWMKTDGSAATNWINSLNLPEENKQSLKSQ